MNSTQSRILFLVGGAVIVLLLLIGLILSLSSPLKPVRGFMKEIEAQQKDAALSYVKESIDQAAKDDIAFFVEDWMTAGKATVEIEKTDAYSVNDPEGDAAPSFNPTPKYWSRNARVFLTVGFEEFDDPVMFTLERKSNGNGIVKNLFRGWQIVAIEYQPIGEDEESLGLDGEEIILEDGSEIELDESADSADEEVVVDAEGDQEDPGTIEQ